VRANVVWHPLLRAMPQPAPRGACSARKLLSLRDVVRDVIQGRPAAALSSARAGEDAGAAQAQEREQDRSTVLITGGLGRAV